MASNDPTNTRRYVERDKQFLWHPFTPMQQWLAADDEPGRVIVAGEGFDQPCIASAKRAFHSASSYSPAGVESATMPPPTPNSTSRSP